MKQKWKLSGQFIAFLKLTQHLFCHIYSSKELQSPPRFKGVKKQSLLLIRGGASLRILLWSSLGYIPQYTTEYTLYIVIPFFTVFVCFSTYSEMKTCILNYSLEINTFISSWPMQRTQNTLNPSILTYTLLQSCVLNLYLV